jgi:hypothetical protein
MAHTWLLSGIPRSGTSLCCRLAGELPATVALSEPLALAEFEDLDEPAEAVSYIEAFAGSTRTRILEQGVARSTHVEGRLNDGRVAAEADSGGLRLPQGEQGEMAIGKPLTADFQLLIKHNALFAALLPELTQRFDCLALVRNPLAVLASWQTVDLPINRGHIPAGEKYAPQLRSQLQVEPLVLQKQLLILDWFFSQYQAFLPPSRILRYETLVESGAETLFNALGVAQAPSTELENRNTSTLYDSELIDHLLAALLDASGQWSHFYSRSDCEQLAASMREAL